MPDPRDVTTPFGRLKLSASKTEGGGVVVERLVEITAPRVPRADYDKFRDLATSIDLAAKEKVVLAN